MRSNYGDKRGMRREEEQPSRMGRNYRENPDYGMFESGADLRNRDRGFGYGESREQDYEARDWGVRDDQSMGLEANPRGFERFAGTSGWNERYRSGDRSPRHPQESSRHHESFFERMGEKVGEFFGKGPKGYKRSDSRIQEDISEALYRHPYIDASDVEVTVEDGMVTLSGTVRDRGTKRMIEDEAERVTGVKDVSNGIRLVDSRQMDSMREVKSNRGFEDQGRGTKRGSNKRTQ